MQASADSNTSYRYLKFGKYLACLDQTVLSAYRSLGQGFERNKLGSIGIPKSAARKAIKAVIRDRLLRSKSDDLVELPAFGNIGMQVHRGWKLFDFERQEVTKVFAPGTDAAIATAEASASKQASQIEAAPRFIAEDAGQAWYREEYICGVHATDPEFRSTAAIPDFYPDVEKCLLDLVGCAAPVRVDAVDHFKQLASSSFRDRWSDSGQDGQIIDEISTYAGELREWLTRSTPDQLQLVLTHGDFSLVNAISTATGLRFIDWEGVSAGGLYTDIFNFVFAEKYYDRAPGDWSAEMSAFIDAYRGAALVRFPELRAAAEIDPAFARRQYYLERLSLMLDRSVSTNLSNVVGKSINMFREFDRDAGDVGV